MFWWYAPLVFLQVQIYILNQVTEGYSKCPKTLTTHPSFWRLAEDQGRRACVFRLMELGTRLGFPFFLRIIVFIQLIIFVQ